MAITSTFNILTLNVAPSLDGLTDVVTSVVSQVVSTDGTYYAQQTFTDPVGAPSPGDFTAYPDLTQAQVLTWIPDHGADPVVLNYLATNIAEQANPPIITPPLPWAAPSA